MTLLALAISYARDGGLSVLPIGEEKKPMLDAWKPYQQRAADEPTIRRWFANGTVKGVAAVCGKVSGGLLVIDFDVPRFYEAWRATVGDIAKDLPTQRTGNGVQVWLRCDEPGVNTHLAWVAEEGEQAGRRITIETRGEGGYSLLPGSLHPNGRTYEVIAGDFTKIPHVEMSRVRFMLDVARRLDEAPFTTQQLDRAANAAVKPRWVAREHHDVIGKWNTKFTIQQSLERAGYIPAPLGRYTRPGPDASPGSVVVFDEKRSYHHSTNDPLHDGHAHDSFSIFCETEHGGDCAAAVKAAAKELGLSDTSAAPEESLPASIAEVAGVRLAASAAGTDGKIVVVASSPDGREIARDTINRNSKISRQRLVGDILARIGPDQATADEVDAVVRTLQPPLAEEAGAADLTREEVLAARDKETSRLLESMPDDVVAEAESMLADPALIDRIVADIETVGIVGESTLGLVIYIGTTSRLLETPISGNVQGTSSSGKSHLITRVGTLLPPEAVLIATDMTANSLYYLPFGRLVHTAVLAGERPQGKDDQIAEARRALREMQSSGELRKVLPIALPDGGFESRIILQPGPIAFFESTTRTRLFDEDANRMLLLSTDERSDQTARVVTAMAERAEGLMTDGARVIIVHHALQRLLKRVRVTVPYASAIARTIPTKSPQARRAFGQILAVIQAVTLLHQRQRAPMRGSMAQGATIEATMHDYVVARRLLTDPLGRALGGALQDSVARFGHRLEQRFTGAEFSSTEALRSEEVLTSRGKVNEYLRTLADVGVLECVEEGRGGRPNRFRFIGSIPEGGVTWLPTVEQVERVGQP